MQQYDYDWLVIGSGFGGSVSALRLSEKGYKVGVLEEGRRFKDEDFAASAWDLKRYLWSPLLGLRGILRMSPFRDVFIFSGAGVGGGSLVYANTLYRAKSEFFENPQWKTLDDWKTQLAPHYQEAERMLGVVTVPFESPADSLLKLAAEQTGMGDTFTRTPVGVFFGEPGVEVADPYFGGTGPRRSGCKRCGACMIGCRHGAKNTLVKNYLWFAEKAGAQVLPDQHATDIRPLGAADGSDGYEVFTKDPGAWGSKATRRYTARGVIVAAGARGTNHLLANCKHSGSLPRISDRLGELVRTNSESIMALTLPDDSMDVWNTVAISASVHVDADTHIEFVTYGQKADFMGAVLLAPLTGKGTRLTRPLKLLGNILRHPLTFLRLLWPFGWSQRTLIVLVMQSLDNAIAFRAKPRLFGHGVKLTTDQDAEKPNPTFIEAGHKATEFLARHTGGVAQSMVLEALANVPSTAHILGGAVIGSGPDKGVIDAHHRVFGYQNLMVCDGAAVPANPGVNPSLTITAMAEAAMAAVPMKTTIEDTRKETCAA
ncbi:MAG: GMC family oxidoreductase [Gammaproteobacteria bacterium]|nr:GMC family oxidoreductase [Gammaproteobacteria bacterium]